MMNRLGFFAAMSANGLPLPTFMEGSTPANWTSNPQTFTWNDVSIGAEPTGSNKRYIFFVINSYTAWQSVNATITANTLAGSTRVPLETYHGIGGVDTYNNTVYVWEQPTGTTASFSWTLQASSAPNTGANTEADLWVYTGPEIVVHLSGKKHKAGDTAPDTVTDTYYASAQDDILFASCINVLVPNGGPDQDGVLFPNRSATSGRVSGVDYTNSTTGTVEFDENVGGANSETCLIWTTYKARPAGIVRDFYTGGTCYLEIATTELVYPWSFSAWVYLPTPVNFGGIMGVADNNTDDDGLTLRHSSTQYIEARVDNPSTLAVASADKHPSNRWFHCGAVFTSSTSRKVYLNGVETANTTSWSNVDTPAKIRIGHSAVDGAGGPLKGMMCHAGIWTKSLTAANMVDLARQALPPDVDSQNMLAYLSMTGPNVETVDAGTIGPFTKFGVITDTSIPPPF